MPTKKKDSAIDIGGDQSSGVPGVHTAELNIELSPVHGRAPMFTRPIPVGSNNTQMATPPGPQVHVDLGANPTFMRNPSALPPSVDLGVNPTFTRTPAMSSNPRVNLGVNPTFTRRIPGNKITPSALPNTVDLGINPTFTRVVATNASASRAAEKVGEVEQRPNAMFTKAIPDSATHVRTTSPRIDPRGDVADMQVYYNPGTAEDMPPGDHPIFGRNSAPSKIVMEGSSANSQTATATPSTSKDAPREPNLPAIRLYHRTPPVPPAYKFLSPFVADHIITDDAAFTGNKIFRPPSYSIHGEMRHTKSQAAGPIPLVGRCSPPLDHTKLNLDSLRCTSNFDPPVTFNYTRTHLERVHERVMSNSGRYDYIALLEMLASARRNQLQMEMRLQNVLSLELKELQNIRQMLEQQLEALDEVEELESSE